MAVNGSAILRMAVPWSDQPMKRKIKCRASAILLKRLEITGKPAPFQFLQDKIVGNPLSVWSFMHARPFRFGQNLVQNSCFWMDIKLRPARICSKVGNGKLAAAPTMGVGTPDFSTPHEGVTLHHLKHVNANVCSDDVVWFDDLCGLAVNIIPGSTDVRSQPAFERSQVFAEPFAICVGPPHSLFLWEKFIRQVRASVLFAAATAVTRFFDDDLVHV
jgi:hypothetical protein